MFDHKFLKLIIIFSVVITGILTAAKIKQLKKINQSPIHLQPTTRRTKARVLILGNLIAAAAYAVIYGFFAFN